METELLVGMPNGSRHVLPIFSQISLKETLLQRTICEIIIINNLTIQFYKDGPP